MSLGFFLSNLIPSFSLLRSSQMNEGLLDEIIPDMKILINVRFLGVEHIIEWYLLSKLPLVS